MDIPTERIKAVSATVVEDQPAVRIQYQVSNLFRDKLEHALFMGDKESPPVFTKGSDLKIHYRFIQFTAGSRFLRWLAGGIGSYGEGVMTIEVRFFNSSGREISKIHSEGKIGAGVFGGSINGAVEKCVEEIVRYAKQTFRLRGFAAI
ncbi:MAG: hypothetical protein R6T98_06010 [Desulfatiglandales bacterium]